MICFAVFSRGFFPRSARPAVGGLIARGSGGRLGNWIASATAVRNVWLPFANSNTVPPEYWLSCFDSIDARVLPKGSNQPGLTSTSVPLNPLAVLLDNNRTGGR